VGFAEFIFTSLIRISTLNSKSRHYMILSTPRVVQVRQTISSIGNGDTSALTYTVAKLRVVDVFDKTVCFSKY